MTKLSLKEQFAAKKQAKHQHIIAAQEKARLEQIKRDKDWKLRNNHISPIEFANSTYRIYLDRVKQSLIDNSLTLDLLFEEIVQLHRFTFMQNLDYVNIRAIIESLFDKYCIDIWDECTPERLASPVKIHHKQRELLHQFCCLVYAEVASFTLRSEFAKANLDMITNHQIYCGIKKPVVARFISQDGVTEAQETIRLRVHQKELYTEAKSGKRILIDETGDYIYSVNRH